MAGESLTQMARRKNAKRMATQRKAEADRSEPPPVAGVESSLPTLVEKTVQIDTAETKHIVVDQQDNQEAKHKGEKRSAEHEADSSENLTGKRPRIEESDLVVLFIIQPRIKNVPVASDASAVKDAAVALSVASSISLPVDRATFRVELDLLSIALAAQSAILVHDLSLVCSLASIYIYIFVNYLTNSLFYRQRSG
ncbi:hypothetical protein CsSME_00034524 [Camellia sinensis var. sinensis]